MLPGLEPPAAKESPLVTAARRTIAAVDGAGLLRERDALTCALILDLSAAVSAGTRGGRASATAMAAAQLLAAIDRLPTPPEGGDDDADPYTALARELRDAALQAGLEA
jgi:hypothetical protein